MRVSLVPAWWDIPSDRDLETLDAIAENPRRLGKRLMLEREGRFSARRGPYRIIYEIDEDDHLVRVIAIGHRRDVYHRR